MFGIANLTERDTLGWVNPLGAPNAADLSPVASMGAVRMGASAMAREEEARGPVRAQTFEVHAGRWSAQRTAVVYALRVAPPGLSLAPMVGDWTMAALLAGEPDAAMAPEPAFAAAAVLSARMETGSDGARWWLYIECKSPPNVGLNGAKESPAADETVRVWLGAAGRAGAILRISSRGSVVDERALERGGEGPVAGATVTRREDRWVCQTPLPAGVVDEDGLLRIGIERTDARGHRSAWPRAMLPWQVEPGRLRVDLKTWGAVEQAAGPAAGVRVPGSGGVVR
jgi:hypothetical protein